MRHRGKSFGFQRADPANLKNEHKSEAPEELDGAAEELQSEADQRDGDRLEAERDEQGDLNQGMQTLMRPEKFTDYALLQHFMDTGTLLYLPDGPIDLASKSGRLLGTIRAAVAGLERREILDRIASCNDGGGMSPLFLHMV